MSFEPISITFEKFNFTAGVQCRQARVILKMKLTSRLLVHAVLLGLSLTFAGKTIQSIIEYRAGKVSSSERPTESVGPTGPKISAENVGRQV